MLCSIYLRIFSFWFLVLFSIGENLLNSSFPVIFCINRFYSYSALIYLDITAFFRTTWIRNEKYKKKRLKCNQHYKSKRPSHLLFTIFTYWLATPLKRIWICKLLLFLQTVEKQKWLFFYCFYHYYFLFAFAINIEWICFLLFLFSILFCLFKLIL